ncbi:P22 phage major capsid protein family protein [Casimicrobium huifangae]|uniref:P22 phage major capsid protein family protein n=1 Tax=Casimicrobium huifangae TaxID=2591109 RepID=UPI003783FE67
MANSILTPTAVTREALRILHQKCSFVGSINRQYDDSFGKTGAKIGDSLKVRLPNKYTVTTGATLTPQDTTESSVTLQVATQKHVGLNFTSDDLTLDLDSFSKRVLEPAISVLAAAVEADAYSMYKNVYNMVDNDTAAFSFLNVMQARQRLQEELAPAGDRYAQLSPAHNVKLINDVKGLFHDGEAIKKQYREGMVGRTGGLDFYENTHVGKHTTGTAAKSSGYLVNGGSQTGATLTVDTGTTTFLVGDVITIAGVNRVHPETKVDTGILQQFVVTANSGTSATSLALSPSIVTSGASQNVTGSPADNAAITKVGAGASETLDTSMVYHQDAFTIAFADLIMPQGVDFGAREVMDGIAMRIVRQYDINNDKFPCRVDVLYGYKALRPELACRIHADG